MNPDWRDALADTWSATDALGRSLPGAGVCGPPRDGKFVGVFYFLWLERHAGDGLFDISKLTAENPEAPAYGPLHAFHWWGEPRLGYYIADDAFVIRKHAQMLTDAGVDAVFFDVTNALTYDHNFLTICEVYRTMRAEGADTPQIAFLANTGSAQVVQGLYERFYSKDQYPELWFRWRGKPIILSPTDGLSPEVLDFFTVRHSWAWTDPNGWFGTGKDKWPWVDHHPQKPGWSDDPNRPEQISVCTAQHPVSNIGRSFHDGKQPPPDERAPELGLCFAEQLERALEVDPEFLFITGWNEWIAQRFVSEAGGQPFLGNPVPPGGTFFVDQYNQEYSRDIEPMRGGHGDNYYYQMVAAIRRFKGVRAIPPASPEKTIRIDGDFSQWDDVAPEFLDDSHDTTHRDHPGWDTAGPYVNTSGRNDFVLAKVARDAENVYCYIRTRDPITAPEGPTWMTLLLDSDGDPTSGWEGFDLAVNRTLPGHRLTVERSTGGWTWEPVGEAEFLFQGNEMHLAIPRALLGLGDGALALEFKWIDHAPESGDILDLIDQGDAAPNGRFRYRYETGDDAR